MEKNLLNCYVRKRLKSAERQLSKYVKDKNPERLHRLRLDIKELKAIFSFAQKSYSGNYDISQLKGLFLDAGKIRSTQINIRWIKFAPNPPQTIISKLEKKENALIQRFVRDGSKNTLLIRNFRSKFLLPATLPSMKAIKKYFKKEIQKAEETIKIKNRECMHRYRTKIKKLLYAYDILPQKIKKEIKLNESEIKKQDKKLGNWHDIYTATASLSFEHFPAKALDFYSNTKEKEKVLFEDLYKNLTSKSIR